jgi:hypothetical protein
MLPTAPPGMMVTCDPWVYIEEQRPGYVRYRCLASGERWEVLGTCALKDGDPESCMQGSVDDRTRGDRAYWANPGPPEGRLDIPISVRYPYHERCGLRCVALPSMQDLDERLPVAIWNEQENARLAALPC